MKKILNILILLLLSACGSGQPELAKLSNNDVILAFGDSLTYGYGVDDEESYPAVLETLSGIEVINEGVSGEESGPGLKRLRNALNKHQPDLLILCHGGNDLLRKKSVSKMESNIRQMIQLAKDNNIPVVLIGVPKPGLFLSSSKVYKDIADSMDVVFIEDMLPEILADASLKSDAVHPNKDGYRVIAETVHTVLKDSGAL